MCGHLAAAPLTPAAAQAAENSRAGLLAGAAADACLLLLVLCLVPDAQEQLHSWMLDKTGRDQFVIKHGDEVMVLWNDGRRCRADEAYKRAFWTGGVRRVAVSAHQRASRSLWVCGWVSMGGWGVGECAGVGQGCNQGEGCCGKC